MLARAFVAVFLLFATSLGATAQHRQYTYRPGPNGVERVPFVAPAQRQPFGRPAQRDGIDPLWTMDVINNLSNLTVLGMRPSTPGKFAVIDHYPKGDVPTSGQSMDHWCDRDLDVPNTGLACAQVLMTKTAVKIGVIVGGDGPEVPVELICGGVTNQKCGILRRNVTTLAPELIVGAWSSTAALAQMQAMQREMDRMAQRLSAAEAKVRRMERAGVLR